MPFLQNQAVWNELQEKHSAWNSPTIINTETGTVCRELYGHAH